MKKFVPSNKIVLSESQNIFIKDNFHKFTNKQLADKFNMKLTTMRMKIYELGLKRMEMDYWTDEQVEFLKENYHYMGDKEIAEFFETIYPKSKKWIKQHIEKKRRYLNLKRTHTMLNEIRKREVAKGTYINGVNKMWEVRGVKPVGHVFQWGKFQMIKTESGIISYGRYLWMEHYGSIPDRMNVVRKNTMEEWSKDNLELLSDAELAARNSMNHAALPAELQKLIRINNKITKTIKNHGSKEN